MRLITQQIRNGSRQTTSPETETQPLAVQQQQDLDATSASNSFVQPSTVAANDSPVIRSIQNTQSSYPRIIRSISPAAGTADAYSQVIRQLPTRSAYSDSDDQLDSLRSMSPDNDEENDDENKQFNKTNGPVANLRDYSSANPASFGTATEATRHLDSPYPSSASSPDGTIRYTGTKSREGRPLSPETAL